MSATIRNLKDIGLVVSTTSTFNSCTWPVPDRWTKRKTGVDYQKLNQVETPIAVAMPDVVSLLEEINISPDILCVPISLANALFLVPAPKDY